MGVLCSGRGRIHLESQNFDKLYTPHHKTFLKRKEKFAETTATEEGGGHMGLGFQRNQTHIGRTLMGG